MPKPCFVIQPIGPRSDNVFDWYLTPALSDRYELIQPEAQASPSITDDIFTHLREDALVVAFLGSPFRVPTEGNHWLWNPNVMLEAGYRMGFSRPILFVREKRTQDDEPLLPFDLVNITVIELVTAEEEKERIHRERVIKRIRDAESTFITLAETTETTSVYTYPAATMAFGGGHGKITAASDDAAGFFRYPPEKNVVGLDVWELVKKLHSEMVPSQRAAFQMEQERLLGLISMGRKPLASVCIVFGKDAVQTGGKLENAYLPIVTRFKATPGAATILEVIYLNVTATATLCPDGVVRCNLGMAAAASQT
jgi:hypothetical protein